MTLLRTACPRCDFPRLLARVGVHRYAYAGETVEVTGIESALCHHCGHTFFLPEQGARNAARIADANLAALVARLQATQAGLALADPDPTVE